MRREVEDVPELLHHIQSRLPVREAARTSVLSKSWLRAWYTIPTLWFDVGRGTHMKVVDVDRTLIRYIRDNIPIERFELVIDIENQESASHAEKWISTVATKTCLKELSLCVRITRYGASFMLPDEILSGESLTKITVLASGGIHSVCMTTSQHPVINCVSLRELHLETVRISEEALHHILSSCSLLMKIALLRCCKGFKIIKVKNLPRLYDLQIALDAVNSTTALEISHVPKLGVFSCYVDSRAPRSAPLSLKSHSISLGSSVTQLMLGGVVKDNACLDLINSGFPLLESLTLHMTSWMLGSFHFTCASIMRFSLLSCPHSLFDVQVHAPKLLSFEFDGSTLPSLLFPVSSLKQITLSLSLNLPVDTDFFLKMREALTLSCQCYLEITSLDFELPSDTDIDDLRKRLLSPPARNVQRLSFATCHDECLWERSPFFDAFFEICHPKHVYAKPDIHISHNNHFCRLMLWEVLEKKTGTANWPRHLKHVQIRRDPHQKWKTLSNSHRSFLDGSAPNVYMHFRLMWR